MISVLVADAQPLQRFGFRVLLENTPDTEIVGEAENGAEAVRRISELRPDVVLMDIRMPGVDGIEATRRIVATGGRSRVLVLTTFGSDRYAFAALRAGASGFLLKDIRPEELLAGIRAVAAGDAVIAPALTRRLLDVFADQLDDDLTNVSVTPGPSAIATPVVVAGSRAVAYVGAAVLLALLAYYFVGVDQGATSVFGNDVHIHEFVHDARHLLGFPCH